MDIKYIKNLFLSCVTFFSLYILFYTSSCFAEPTLIGQMVWTKGSVKALMAGSASRPLQRRSNVYEHDTIVTGSGSAGEIVFTDNSILTLRADSTFRIDDYKFSKSGGSNSFVGTLVKGGLRTITGVISKANPDGYQVNTPVATIGVRGTEFSTYCNPKVKGGCTFQIRAGNISVTNEAGTITLNSGTRYASVSSRSSAPVALQQQPVEFRVEPPLMSPSSVSPLPSKTVSGFCTG